MNEEILFADLTVGTVINIGPEKIEVTIDELNEKEEVFWFEHEDTRYYENVSYINSVVSQPHESVAENVLTDLGFMEERHGVFYDKDGRHKVVLAPDGIYAYSVDRNSSHDELQPDYLELHLNFIPDNRDVLTYLIKRVFYLQ